MVLIHSNISINYHFHYFNKKVLCLLSFFVFYILMQLNFDLVSHNFGFRFFFFFNNNLFLLKLLVFLFFFLIYKFNSLNLFIFNSYKINLFLLLSKTKNQLKNFIFLFSFLFVLCTIMVSYLNVIIFFIQNFLNFYLTGIKYSFTISNLYFFIFLFFFFSTYNIKKNNIHCFFIFFGLE